MQRPFEAFLFNNGNTANAAAKTKERFMPVKEKVAKETESEEKPLYPEDEDEQDEAILRELDEEGKKEKEETSEEDVTINDTTKEVTEKDVEAEKEDVTDETVADGTPEKDTPKSDDSTPEKVESKDDKIDVEAYAKENKLSLESAREEVESIENIRAKYGDDKIKLSKAALYALRMYSRTQQELKKIAESKSADFDFDGPDHIVWEGRKILKSEIVKEYQEKYPNKFERLDGDEDAVFEDAKEILKTRAIALRKSAHEGFTKRANEKRVLVLNNVPKEDIKFIDDIRNIVDVTEDSIILNEAYDIEATLCLARGRSYHADIKKAEEAGYKKGLEESKVLGEKGDKPEGSTQTKVAASKIKTSLSESEKREAEEMYEDDKIPLETKYKYYTEYKNNSTKKAS